MDFEEQKEFYGKTTALWRAVKNGDYAAAVATDLAVLIADFLNARNTEENWTAFVHRVGELAMKYPTGAPRLLLDWITHDVAAAIEKREVKDYFVA